MGISPSVAPKFILIRYILRKFIENFGLYTYYIFICGSITAFCIHAFMKSYTSKEWDTAIMIILFFCIVIGGLIGFGMDMQTVY